MFEEISAGVEEVRPGRELFVRRGKISPLPPASIISVIEFTSDPVPKKRNNDNNNKSSSSKQNSPKETVRMLRLQLVLVHGLCGTQEQFSPFLDDLSERLDGQGVLEKIETNSDGEVKSITRTIVEIHCVLYDMVGCGQSPVVHDKMAYSKRESMADLYQLMETYLNKSDPTIVLGHSYGPSIFLSLLSESVTRQKRQLDEETTTTHHSQNSEELANENGRESKKGGGSSSRSKKPAVAQKHLPQPPPHELLQRFHMQGMVFLSSAVRTPSLPFSDGGALLLRKLPILFLKLLNSRLTTNFVETAVLEENIEAQKMLKWQCKSNNMRAVRYWHSQTKWATVEEVQTILKAKKMPTLIVHGILDGILPVEAGQELAEATQSLADTRFVALQKSSHMGLLEEPENIGQAVWDFIENKIVQNLLESKATAAAADSDDLIKYLRGSILSPPAGCCPCTSESY